VPLALSLLMNDAPGEVACAVLLYGYTLDLDGATAIADTARAFGFVNPCAAKGVDALRADVPLFVARAGRDEMPGLNDAMDRFVRTAIAANQPLTFVNHPSGPHAFDLFDDSAASRGVIRQALSYLRAHLAG
jgi:acetyl esterase/lipase